MAEWPDLETLKRALGMDPDEADSRDDDLQLSLDAAVEQVEIDVGEPVTEPSASLARAALLLAVTVWKAPDAPFGVAAVFDAGGIYVARANPNYLRLLKGHRVAFGIA
jgi:hypothetical protein